MLLESCPGVLFSLQRVLLIKTKTRLQTLTDIHLPTRQPYAHLGALTLERVGVRISTASFDTPTENRAIDNVLDDRSTIVHVSHVELASPCRSIDPVSSFLDSWSNSTFIGEKSVVDLAKTRGRHRQIASRWVEKHVLTAEALRGQA